jgi:hypothetical protein
METAGTLDRMMRESTWPQPGAQRSEGAAVGVAVNDERAMAAAVLSSNSMMGQSSKMSSTEIAIEVRRLTKSKSEREPVACRNYQRGRAPKPMTFSRWLLIAGGT